MLQAVYFWIWMVSLSNNNPFIPLLLSILLLAKPKSNEEEFKLHMYGKNNGYILSYFLGRRDPRPKKPFKNVEFEKKKAYSVKSIKAEVQRFPWY